MGFVVATSDRVTEVIRAELTIFAVELIACHATICGGTCLKTITDVIVVAKLLLWCVNATLIRITGINSTIKAVITAGVVGCELTVEYCVAGVACTVEAIITEIVVYREDTASIYTLVSCTDDSVVTELVTVCELTTQILVAEIQRTFGTVGTLGMVFLILTTKGGITEIDRTVLAIIACVRNQVVNTADGQVAVVIGTVEAITA